MIAALERLNALHEPAAAAGQDGRLRHRGGGNGGIKRLFMTHPPLEERIAALFLRFSRAIRGRSDDEFAEETHRLS
jgi:heat shock protein HtpX